MRGKLQITYSVDQLQKGPSHRIRAGSGLSFSKLKTNVFDGELIELENLRLVEGLPDFSGYLCIIYKRCNSLK